MKITSHNAENEVVEQKQQAKQRALYKQELAGCVQG